MAKEGARRKCLSCGSTQTKTRGKWKTTAFATQSRSVPCNHAWKFVSSPAEDVKDGYRVKDGS